MKRLKLILSILLILTGVIAKGQIQDYVIEASDSLITRGVLQINADKFKATTQVSSDDTTLVSLDYLTNLLDASEYADSLAFHSANGYLVYYRGGVALDSTNMDGRYLTAEVDGSTTNELQTLTTSGTPGNIGISGGNTLNINVDDADPSATNELQSLSFTSPNLSISSGNSVNISGINTDSQTLSTSGAAGNISISGGNTINLNVNDADASTINEIQDLSGSGATLSGYILSLSSDATTVTLPNEADPTVGSHIKSITTTDISHWNDAWGWGNHATVGYALAANYVPYTGATTNVNLGAWSLTGNQLISTTTSTAPLSVASTTKVANLNADLLDDKEGTFYRNQYASQVKVGTWSRVLYAEPYSLFGSFMLTIQHTRSSVVVGNTFLVTFGHSGNGQITSLGTHGFTQIDVRLTGDSNNIYFEVLDNGFGTPGEIQATIITLDNINADITPYTAFTDGSTVSGSVKSQLTTVNNRINVDGNTVAFLTDNVASATKLQTARTFTIGNTGKTFDGTGDVSWTLGDIGGIAPHSITNNYVLKSDGLGGFSTSLIYDNGTNVTISAAGSLGIGVDPTAKLDIAGDVKVNSHMTLSSNSSFMGSVGFNRNVYNGQIYNSSYAAHQIHNYLGDLTFQVYNGVGEFVTSSIINSNGNWGINTSTPDSKLTVKGTTTGSAIRAVTADGFGSWDFGYGFYIDTQAREIAAVNASYQTSANGGYGDLLFKTLNYTSGLTEKMRIIGNGNVGIGTYTPAQKLDVNGNIQGTQLISTVAEGTAPLSVSSTTLVSNLNADLLDGQHGQYWADNRFMSNLITDFLTNYRAGVGHWIPSTPNAPTALSANYGTTFSFVGIGTPDHNNSSNWITTLYVPTDSADIYFRKKINGSGWSGLVKLYNDANFLAGTHYQAPLTNPVTGTGTTNYITKWTGLNTVGSSQIYDNGTNVGIGTTTPFSPLEVNGNITIGEGGKIGFRYAADDGNSYNYIKGSGLTALTLAGGLWTSGTTTEAIRFETLTAGNVKMSILNNGNVGIGTTAPDQKLHVAGYAKFADVGLFHGMIEVGGYYSPLSQWWTGKIVGDYFGSSYNANVLHGMSFIGGRSGFDNFRWFTADYSELMTLRYTGNLGIGTTDPQQKLDVNGNIRVRGVGTNTTSTVLGLDSNGDLTTNVTITGGATWKGGWNASTNTPTLSDATGTNGWWYKVTVAGTQNLGSGSITFAVGDDVIHNGTVWQKFSAMISEADPVFVASGAYGITSTDRTNWTTAYNDKINSAAFTGTTTKTLTLTQQDGGTVTANFTDNDTYASTTTGNLTENITGLEFSATRQVIGGATELRLSTGYGIPTTTQIGQIHAAGSDNQTLTIGGTTSPTIALSGSNTATFTGGTGIAFSQSGGTITANHTNAVTAGNAGPTASGSLTFGGTFTVPYATYDAQGHITGTANRTLTMPANPDTDTNTKYSISSATATGGGANLRLNGTDATTDDVKFIGSGATTVSYTDANTITVSSTDNNTTSLPVKNSAGTTQFTADQSAGVRFTGSGATTVSYTPASQLVTISSTDNNTNYWTQASGALYPATITDEVRIGATTDNGTYKLQVTGDTWLNGMTNMTGKIYASGITNTSATHTLYYNPGTDEVTYGKSLYITKDYSLTGYATSKYVLYGLDHINGTMKKLVSSANLSFDQHSFIYNGDIYCIGANRKSIWKVNLTTYAVTKVTTSDYSGFITSMYSENGYIYLTLSRDATGIPTYVYTISTNANTFYGYLFIGEKNPIVEIKAGLNCIIAVSISSEIFATPKWSSKTTKGTAWNRFLDLNDQTFPPGLTVSYLNNVSGVDNFLIFRQNGFSRIASVSTASSACTATLTADNSFIDGYVPQTGDDIFTKMSSMSNVRFPISSSVSWFNGTSNIDGGLYLSNITNTTGYVHTRITDQSATAMNLKVVDQLNNQYVYIFAHGGGVISYSSVGYNDILTMKEIYLLNSDNVVVERVVDNLTFIHLN